MTTLKDYSIHQFEKRLQNAAHIGTLRAHITHAIEMLKIDREKEALATLIEAMAESEKRGV